MKKRDENIIAIGNVTKVALLAANTIPRNIETVERILIHFAHPQYPEK